MPFDQAKVPAFSKPESDTFGGRFQAITPGSSDQLTTAGKYFKYFVAATAGDVTVVGYYNADSDTHQITMAAGQVLPGRIRQITASTATVLGVSD